MSTTAPSLRPVTCTPRVPTGFGNVRPTCRSICRSRSARSGHAIASLPAILPTESGTKNLWSTSAAAEHRTTHPTLDSPHDVGLLGRVHRLRRSQWHPCRTSGEHTCRTSGGHPCRTSGEHTCRTSGGHPLGIPERGRDDAIAPTPRGGSPPRSRDDLASTSCAGQIAFHLSKANDPRHRAGPDQMGRVPGVVATPDQFKPCPKGTSTPVRRLLIDASSAGPYGPAGSVSGHGSGGASTGSG